MKSTLSMLFLSVACAATLATPNLFAQTGRSKKGRPVAPGTSSALPAGDYRPRAGEFGLLAPRPDPYEALLAELCRGYAQSDAATRARTRRSLSEDDLSKLRAFSARAAVFGLRERSAGRLADGLTAISMVELDRVDDERDLIVTLGLLHHSAVRIGAAPGKLFRDAAALAERKMSRLIVGYLARPESIKELRNATGYDEVETEAGVGFIGWEYERYEPTYDLKKVAVDVARLVAADTKYAYVHPSVATKLRRVWLATDDNAALDRALRSVRAGATVHADAKGERLNQMLIVFIVETADEASARTLLDVAKGKKPWDGDSTLALAEGRLFCLLAARSTEYGVKSIETPESILRFSAGLAEILRRHVKG